MSLFNRLALAVVLVSAVSAAHSAPVSGQGTWETTLKARDINGNAVALDSASAAFFYDTTANITWLADMDPIGHDVNWSAAMAWAAALTTGGFTDWRLPTIIDSGAAGCQYDYSGGSDCGYNSQTKVGNAYSEWAHLFYDILGNLGFCELGGSSDPDACVKLTSGVGLTNSAYFRNTDRQLFYSSSTQNLAPNMTGKTFTFNLDSGGQDGDGTPVGERGATAVRTGDVLRVDRTVPEPTTFALLGLGLLGLAATRRRQ